jgi:hypothetical protein
MFEKEFQQQKKTMRDSGLFDEVVGQFFEPIALKLELPLFKVEDGIYEIPSPFFIVRIRLDTGHARGFNVLLRQTSICDFEDYKPYIQYGIGNFVLFSGEKLESMNIFTDEDFLRQAQLLAEASERFAIPYLLGQKNDLEAIARMVEENGREGMERIKQMQRNIERNMPSVRQEWPVIIPPEKGDKRIAAKELQVANIQFLGEQAGKAECILKEKLVEFFNRDQSVKTAYLARFIGFGTPANAALCLRTQFGSDQGMVEKIGTIFATVFEEPARLNIVFLNDEQEASLAKACRPFFGK